MIVNDSDPRQNGDGPPDPVSAVRNEQHERRVLDKRYGADRPKCRICGGRMDRVRIGRCPWCGAREGTG